jgi:hypothetical protein
MPPGHKAGVQFPTKAVWLSPGLLLGDASFPIRSPGLVAQGVREMTTALSVLHVDCGFLLKGSCPSHEAQDLKLSFQSFCFSASDGTQGLVHARHRAIPPAPHLSF